MATVDFIGSDVPGHTITGRVDNEAHSLTLTCSCDGWTGHASWADRDRPVHSVQEMQTLVDNAADHLMAAVQGREG